MKINKIAALLMMVWAGTSVSQAAPLNINITGTVVSSPCVVNNNQGDLNVDLGTNIQASSLSAASSGSTPKPFNLVLSSCPIGTNTVKVTFTGTGDTASPTMYKNTGTASPLAVELSQQVTGTILGNNSNLSQLVQTDRSVTYALSARAFTGVGGVVPGSISSVVQANFDYN